jgi:PAS domain S-box-containing protein
MNEHHNISQQALCSPLFDLMADRIPGIVWATDTDLRVTASFGADLRAVGLHAGQSVGKMVAEFFASDEDASAILTAHSRALQGESVEFDQIWSDHIFQVRVESLTDKTNRVIGCIGFAHDVTAQKRTEKAVRDSEEEARRQLAETDTIYNSAPIGLCIFDTKMRYIRINERLAALNGVPSAQHIGRTTREVMPALADWTESMLQQVMNTGQPIMNVEFKGTTPAQPEELRTWTVNWVPLKEVNGLVTGVSVVVEEITNRKRAEEALKNAHDELERRVEERTAHLQQANRELELLRLFAQSADQAFGIADLQGFSKYVNPAMCRLLGEERAENVIGRPIWDFAMSQESLRDIFFPTLLKEGRWNKEGLFRMRDGNLVPVWNSSVVVRDDSGEPKYFATVLTDLTERKRADQALIESEAKYRQLVETTDTGYAILDEQGRVVDANMQYVRLTGHHALEEILGLSVVEWTAPHDFEHNADEIKKCVATGSARQLEIDYVCADSRIIPIEINASCIETPQGKRILALHRDISERRQAQAALQREQQTLRHLLQSSDHERQVIAYEIHDGLAQYLAGSIMQFQAYADLKDTKPQDAAKAYEAGMVLLHQSHSDARQLINGVRPPILDDQGIVAAISHLVNDHKHRVESKIVFHAEVSFNRLAPILENATYRIAQEALANACKHSNSKRIQVKLTQHADHLQVSVQDWGDGFDPSKVGKGHFGIAGIRERVRLLGGELELKSSPGAGTCVTAKLPLLVQ